MSAGEVTERQRHLGLQCVDEDDGITQSYRTPFCVKNQVAGMAILPSSFKLSPLLPDKTIEAMALDLTGLREGCPFP
ncbi:hypothetical protein OPV22_025007 [Ensete ventricosum]|uniref:Uncharacterized protein n=1 Tax=Ensete ventricosum TaxID=4639 RepID=A0AAV8QBT6_ENSVE|nr:hypothetical protein OPV22_025007 [Ensete ventricosum]